MADIYFWRQVFILAPSMVYSMTGGVMLSFPSVMNPDLLSPNSTITATSNEASWLSACIGVSGMFGFFILSPIFQIYGRKAVHISFTFFLFAGWIVISLAQDITALFVGRIIQGLAIGGVYIDGMVISEYADPKRRGYFVTLKKVSIAVGTLICHGASLFLDWRQIAELTIIPPAISIILTLFWPESPSYLAYKGDFKKSEESYLWLHGASNMKELEVLLSSQSQKIKNPEKFYRLLLKKDFLKPFLIVSILTLLLDLCGKYYFQTYVVEIMIEIIGDKSLAIYCSMGADVLSVIALILSCFIIKRFNRRAIMWSFGIATVALMLLISLFIVLRLSILVWLTPTLILVLCFVVNIGLIPLCYAVVGEILPLEHKGYGSCVIGIVFTLFYTLITKLTPVLMESTGVGGVFTVYGISIAICLIALYFLVPETKDRTLQEIEQEFKGLKQNLTNLNAQHV